MAILQGMVPGAIPGVIPIIPELFIELFIDIGLFIDRSKLVANTISVVHPEIQL